MPLVNRSRFRQRGSSNRRKTAWSAGPRQANIQFTAAGASLWALGSQALEDGLTVVRVRGQFLISLIAATSISDGFERFGLGICNVTENAFGIGVTAVPDPLVDIGWDGWLYHQLVAGVTGFSTTETGASAAEVVRMEIDSKAMRKTRAGDILIGVIGIGTETGAATVQFRAETRILDKLS